MHTRLMLGLVVLSGCTASSSPLRDGGSSLQADASEQRAEVREVDLGGAVQRIAATQEDTQSDVQRGFISRSALAAGTYRVAFSESSHHGCSQSWSSTSRSGQAALQVAPGVIQLRVDSRSLHTSGSRFAAGNPSRTEDTVRLVFEGQVEETGEGDFKAVLKQHQCDGDCGDGDLTLVCKRVTHQLGDEESDEKGDEPARSGGQLEGYACTSVRVIPGVPDGKLLVGSGLGLRQVGNQFHYGEAAHRLYRQTAERMAETGVAP